MPAKCSPPAMQFARLDGRAVAADFGDGVMTSDAGALLLGATDRAIGLLVLDLDATNDPLHGHQEGRFFHGYYDCYCYLPLYIFCGDHLLAALRRIALAHARLARATCGSIRLKLLKIGAQVRLSTHRIRIAMASSSTHAARPRAKLIRLSKMAQR